MFGSRVPTLICKDRLAPALRCRPLFTHKHPQAAPYPEETAHLQTAKMQTSTSNQLCNTARNWFPPPTINNIPASGATHVDSLTDSCCIFFNVIWIMKGKLVVFGSNQKHSFANRCLTLTLSAEEMILQKELQHGLTYRTTFRQFHPSFLSAVFPFSPRRFRPWEKSSSLAFFL